MNFDVENLQQQIPYYLTAEDKRVLVEELKAITSGGTADYILSTYHDSFKEDMLQGDGWRGFQLFLFDTGQRRSVRGLVLSNSCDVDLENPRELPARVIFAPLVKLTAYEELLDSSGIHGGRGQRNNQLHQGAKNDQRLLYSGRRPIGGGLCCPLRRGPFNAGRCPRRES